MDTVQYGETRVEGSEIEVVEGAPAEMRITLRSPGPPVAFSLKEAPVPAGGRWTVQSIPLFGPPTRGMGVPDGIGRAGDTAQSGPLLPGKYCLLALEMTYGGGMQNERLSRLLCTHVEPVEVTAASGQTLTPRFFRAEDVQKIVGAYLAGEAQ